MSANSPLKRTAELQLAHTLDDLNRTEDALTHLRALIQRDQNDIEAWTTLGNVLRVRKRFGEAVEAYGRAVAMVPNPQRQNWTLFFYYGIVLERSKRWPEAEANFQRALALEPDQPMVLNYLGYSWVDQNMRVEEALGMLRRAVEQRPTDGDIIDSVGWAYYRLGRYEEAVGWLERAVAQKPADPTINDHLGDAYWKVGRFLEARFQIQPRTGRWTLNQLSEILHLDRPQWHAARLLQQIWTAVLQQRHEINAHRRQHQQPGRPQAEQLLQKRQKALRLRFLAIGISAADQQLLKLVDHQQELATARDQFSTANHAQSICQIRRR
jgi:tetratricopeptide (TPR) repeat protein